MLNLTCCGLRKSEKDQRGILRSSSHSSATASYSHSHAEPQKRGVAYGQVERVKLGASHSGHGEVKNQLGAAESIQGLQVNEKTEQRVVVGAEDLGLVLGVGSKGVVVQSVVKGSPCFIDGRIKEGDIILSIDNEDVQDFNHAVQLLEGEKGTCVGIKTERHVARSFDPFIRKQFITLFR
ncbi:hypothetical protein GUITHDRAFT_133061 [Guillardia theta CCMP2712]|uniref:PDZ domain-containing protein n=1 Tax=Guillardia theta (strain CCMP2712) TaxID=905079 RepID=L1JYA1_GUITC|nr:hypothetical protein GUITHDRAFT_133061 [Guillardia theta CCMP2712]EKX53327.1 hypothetical protein GUITHDRAFT_133061 [Guillardia theta CCMP2712]|eukprot:XP_005840307.1 hypothetical protein GUITHDRAFT_133061 [Guillardia theta CCMP2712]